MAYSDLFGLLSHDFLLFLSYSGELISLDKNLGL